MDEPRSLRLKLKKTFTKFSEESSIQAISKLVSARCRISKIVWALLLLFVWTYCTVITAISLADYLSYPTTLRTAIYTDDMLPQFPAILICGHDKSYPSSYVFNNRLISGVMDYSDSCSVFNSGYSKNGELKSILQSKLPGQIYGLRFTLKSYSSNQPTFVFIYNQSRLPENRIPITTDSDLTIRLGRTLTQRLGPPYGDCQSDLEATDEYGPIPKRLAYQTPLCYKKCINEKIARLCDFYPRYMSNLSQLFYTDPFAFDENFAKDMVNCSESVLDNFLLKHPYRVCQCPNECQVLTYAFETFTSYAGRSENESLLTTVEIFFDSPEYTVVQTEPATTLLSLLGKIGGVVSLLTGCTVIGIAEILEFLCLNVWVVARHVKGLFKEPKPRGQDYEI